MFCPEKVALKGWLFYWKLIRFRLWSRTTYPRQPEESKKFRKPPPAFGHPHQKGDIEIKKPRQYVGAFQILFKNYFLASAKN